MMYGHRRSSENGLMTNLNSISSSISSIDTAGRTDYKSTKTSVDNLLLQRGQMTASTSAWWRNHRKEEQRYSKTKVRNTSDRATNHHYGTGVHHYAERERSRCLSSRTALTFVLSLLLLLTIVRQTFDFLSQLWLQILINFISILIIIIALFGIKQNRISYLILFISWALFNTLWNLLVISIHLKLRDITINEDILSLYTGATSWWHANGPGCLPYSITASLQQSVSLLKPNIITGCRFDYHLLESAQAATHSCLSLIALLLCCYVALVIGRHPFHSSTNKMDKPYRLNDLTNGRSKVNHDPFPVSNTSRFVSDPTSLRRANNKASSRSSQHSIASARSERRRQRHLAEAGVSRTPRGSTSSMQRSQKYGSLSSRRSSSNRRDRRGDISSLTYATTAATPRVNGTNLRNRQSSVSSADYLPSYQPPHSSSANLLSSYGEISSIDSYNNPLANRGSRGHKFKDRGNTNPVYNGSRTSVCSQNINNNYDDISNVYGVNTNNGSVYGASNSISDRPR